jgi:DNA repair exonuclease SbcCD nuclease subunit
MISKIFHIADVHIRNFKRHTEYKAIFKQVYKYLKSNVDSDSVIYLAGDIVHSKNDMSPELVQVVADFFKSCADIAPTILITGNHDTNLNNDSRLDALTPIVSTLNHPNLYYWKDTGVYELKGVKFSVFSVYGTPNEWILAKDIDADYKIALHHGAVNSAITDLDHEIQNEFVGPKMFEGFDLSLLGDIHKRQFLNSEKTIAYAGSLIQQNHGEDLEHGFFVWDLKPKKSEFVEIKNTIAYATIEMVDGKITTPRTYIDSLPKNLNLRIKYNNTNYKDVTKVIQLLKTKHKLLETTVIKVNNHEYLTTNSHTVLGDVRDVEYQNELLTAYFKDLIFTVFKDSNTNTHVDIDRLRHVNRVMNSKLDNSNVVVRNVIWKPLTFEFSNMFSYGEHNIFDLSNFTGIQGLFAPNASGKSTLLDAVTFCLFDKCSRTYRAADVLNNKKTKFTCKLTLELNDEIFIIERVGEKHKKTGNIKVDVNFGKIVNGQYESLNDKDRDKTNKVIRGYIGSYDDFLLTALSTQNDNKNFIFKTQRERKDLLNSFLDISIFDELYVLAKNEIKGKQALIKNLELDVLQDQYTS